MKREQVLICSVFICFFKIKYCIIKYHVLLYLQIRKVIKTDYESSTIELITAPCLNR